MPLSTPPRLVIYICSNAAGLRTSFQSHAVGQHLVWHLGHPNQTTAGESAKPSTRQPHEEHQVDAGLTCA
eukprot:2186398-Amphidinium_carterae.1